MKSKSLNYRKHLVLIFLVVLYSLAIVNNSTANTSEFKWRVPYIFDSTYQIESFEPTNNGFEIYVSKNSKKTYWHIQIITDDVIKLSDIYYVIIFKAKSNKEFDLYSRLGEDQYNDGNSYIDKSWSIIGDGEYHEYRYDFKGKKEIANFLFFQIGKATPGTHIEISDIQIKPIN